MRDRLLALLADTNPKQIGGALKRDAEIKDWLLASTSDLPEDAALSERAYLMLDLSRSVSCDRGHRKRFISITQGHGFCGKAAHCACAKESVAAKVSAAKKDLSDEARAATNQKRSTTNLQRYGVSNAGQTAEAKIKHREFYQDSTKVAATLTKMQQTTMEHYGAINPLHVEEIKAKAKATLLERYGVDNINKTAAGRSRMSLQSKSAWQRRKESNLDYHKLNAKFKAACNIEFTTTPEDYKGTVGNIWYGFRCISCDSKFDTWISCGHLPVCKTCNPTRPQFKSGEENEVFDHLISLGINARQRDRKLINPSELDIVCDDRKIAIEYCGLYWHSELSQDKTKDYHLKKMLACEARGYRLITIFSDEWNIKKEIVKSKLAAIFGKLGLHVGARDCRVTILDPTTAMDFYDRHHLQGRAGAEIHLGLMHGSDVVAAMSFGRPRTFIKNSGSKHQYELIRYATSCHVRGGAGRLLRHFERTYSPRSVISYADARWSDGGMYMALGFQQIDIRMNPGYWYTKDYARREHRFGYTKANLIAAGHDASLSEWEIMQSLGYDRIWDCGQRRYEKIYS